MQKVKKDIVSIVIPTYNERENIEVLIPRIFDALEKKKVKGEVIIVDDNSPDKTGIAAEGFKEKYRVNVIHRKAKLDLSSAVLEGFKIAEGEIIGVMDADISHPPESIPKLAKPIFKGEADFVVGSRYMEGGEIKDWPLSRIVISKFAGFMARGLTNIKDPMSGFYFFKRKVIESVNLKTTGYKIGLEIVVKGRYGKLKEIPYTFTQRKTGESKFSFKEVLNYVTNLFKLYCYKVKK
ncbi:MAG: glycosyltransferase [Candidatus Aenigmarchaeota archaeon]|nr:glycosyltransferase [Candidatus Aenigmarchaeota archaeon]